MKDDIKGEQDDEAKKKKVKGSKSERKAALRRKNMGVGIGTIDVNASVKSKKIRFDDNNDVDKEEGNPVERDNVEESKVQGGDSDSDDDEVEQVSAAVAKDEALQIRAAERETRKLESSIAQKRKRKKKASQDEGETKIETVLNNSDHDDDDDLDEEFFTMVDTARANDSRIKKLKHESKVRVKKLGRHTTFVSEDSESNANMIKADHNIEVVVLPSASIGEGEEDQQFNTVLQEKAAATLSSELSTQPSKAAMLFCRGTQSISQHTSKGGQKQTFKRSRKMKYKFSFSKPSVNFAVKKKRNRE